MELIKDGGFERGSGEDVGPDWVVGCERDWDPGCNLKPLRQDIGGNRGFGVWMKRLERDPLLMELRYI